MLDTRLKRNNILALIICFCISIICWNMENIGWYIYNFSTDFYNSINLEQYLYEIATNSVYTVVGDNASEKMLEYRQESTRILNQEKASNIFVKNNNSGQIYSNQDKYDLNIYKNRVGDYSSVYQIDFKDDKMYLLKDGNKVETYTKHYGNLSMTRKEDVTTYIAIPDVDDIKEIAKSKGGDTLYLRYRQYVEWTRETIVFIGSKLVAGICIVGCIIFHILQHRKSKETIKDISIISNMISVVFAIAISIVSSYMYRGSILYLPINTITTFLLCFFIINLIRHTDISKIKYINNWKIIKYIISLIVIMIIQIMITYISILEHNNSIYIPYNVIRGLVVIPIIVNIALFYFIFKKIKKVQEIQIGIAEIKKGNLNNKISIKEDDLFKDIVDDINTIGEVINIAVEERLKSERMKTELITNVSHDLKTPLTAIINYVSLMKKEDIQPEHIKDYVQVLDKRSQRLKVLIDDLFEASKIGSSNIELNLEKTDINQLLHQSIVEMDECIEESKLDFIINTPEHEVYIMADGKKTFRVFENLISNIVKYSLENTRVYIDLVEKEDKVYISLKNISKHQLNFDAEEITERFKRGDLARNTEGSGLGLSIAKGFVQAQDGSFKVDILGDMFIVTIDFNLIKD